jgi:nicotinate-nucleotide adenylyltransferase
MKVGLLFGSFNPIHNGHVQIATRLLERVGFDMVWLIVSPQNPFKQQADLLAPAHRVVLMQQSLRNENKIRVCTEELQLPTPSYTIDTMKVLTEKYPDFDFHIIIGADNVSGLQHWKEIERLLEKYPFHIYARGAKITGAIHHEHLIQHELPLLDISATEIRNRLKSGLSVSGMIHPGSEALIRHFGWYNVKL